MLIKNDIELLKGLKLLLTSPFEDVQRGGGEGY